MTETPSYGAGWAYPAVKRITSQLLTHWWPTAGRSACGRYTDQSSTFSTEPPAERRARCRVCSKKFDAHVKEQQGGSR